MPVVPTQTVSAAGVVDINPDPNSTSNFLTLGPNDFDLFVGVSGSYTGLTFKVEGSRTGSYWYDIATYTSDDVGPLASPLSPADGASVAYKADIRTFAQLKLTVITLATGNFVLEVLTGGFFPQRAGASLSGGIAQLIYEVRAVRATLAGWLGLPAGPLPNLQNESLGSGVGKSFPN